MEKDVRVGPQGLIYVSGPHGILRVEAARRSTLLRIPSPSPNELPDLVAGDTFYRVGAVTPQHEVFADARYFQNGAASVNQEWVYRILPERPAQRETFANCKEDPDDFGVTVAGADGETLLVDKEPYIDQTAMRAQAEPEFAFEVRGRACEFYGHALLTAAAGAYAAGYRVYDSVVTTDGQQSLVSRAVAVRWHEKQMSQLGRGIALDVAADGTAVGADGETSPGPSGELPHEQARLWTPGGKGVALATHSDESVAHAVDAHDRVVGTLRSGKTYSAFIWENGNTRTLDGIVGDVNWHFEAAYDFAPDGRIAGIGTYKKRPAVFLLAVDS
jgi:hypothetical protein